MALSGLAQAMRTGRQASGQRGGTRQRGLVSVGPWGHVNLPSFLHSGGSGGGTGAKPPAGSGGAPITGASGPGSSGPASPLDSTYYQNVAQNQFQTNNQINALNLRQQNASTNLQSQLAQLAHQQPLDQLRLEEQANQRGGLYSTALGQQQGQLNYNYLGRQGAAQNNYGQLVASIASQIAGLRGGEQLYESGQAESAAERAALAAQKDPAVGESSASLAQPVAPAHNAPSRGRTGGRRSGRSGLAQAIAMGRRGGF